MRNKKASIGASIFFIVTLMMWFVLWIVVDTVDYSLDSVLNNTWSALDENDSAVSSWYDTYGVFRTRQTNFKRYAFWGGTIGLIIGYIAYSYYIRAQQQQFGLG